MESHTMLRGLVFAAGLLLASAGLQAQQPASDGPLSPPPPTNSTAHAAPTAAPTSTNSTPAPVAQTKPAIATSAKIEVPIGTHIPLVLHNGISTRSAKPGDPVYLETLFPIMVDGKVVIPAGSYVSGEVTEAKRPGRVKGRAEIMLRLDNLILPNAYQVSFIGTPGNAGTGGNESVDKEGKVSGDTDKAGDAATIAKTTIAGAGIGGIADGPKGLGIGAGIGAATGLAAVLLSRGPEAELPRGTTLEAVLDRPLFLDSDKVQFTSPGQASTLAGPPNREPQRSRSFPY